MGTTKTITIENSHMPPFFTKIPVSIERGDGVYVWDEDGNKYLDLTAGWGVTSIGHAHPTIQTALKKQAARILQNPNSGLTYSPVRARLLSLLEEILPANLTRVFFTNSGAEANDAAIKLARKVTGRRNVVAMEGSFHGRTISTASATGQAKHRENITLLCLVTSLSHTTTWMLFNVLSTMTLPLSSWNRFKAKAVFTFHSRDT
jgi:acetylornithine/N-succinyldiaminopimelate aminotransferase